MKRLLPLVQYLPLSIFLILSKQTSFESQNWAIAFKVAGMVGAFELALIFYFTRNNFHRLVTAATLFLITGAIGFFFEIDDLLNLLNELRESTLLLMMTIVCTVATLTTKTGAFEHQWAAENTQKKYSYYFILCTLGALVWSYSLRGNSNAAGFAPVVALILTKVLFQKLLASKSSD